MKQWGIEFVIVNNGEEVIQQLRTSVFSLILMDIQMPKMDGYATTLAIRNDLNLNIPIIAMTAHAMAGEKENCLSYGMNEYISKPLKEGELFSLIQSYTQPVNVENNEGTGIIDLAYLRELSNGDTEFEQAIIYQFVVQIPNELDGLRDAILQKDFLRIKSVAHGMKSSVAYMGLSDKIYPYLQMIEAEAAKNNDSYHYIPDFEQVENLCKQAIEDAKNLLTVSV
jgi:CheY-like chemotaxis protein